MEQDTIAAIATPIGSSGIGILRISGPNAVSIVLRLFRGSPHSTRFSKCQRQDKIKTHQLIYGHIYDPTDETLVDEVLLAVMKAPRSYTREDVVEIQAHSGPVILSKMLNIVLGQGARMAEPGEFTKRAFLNGRIDLSQAEAVADMIAAKTEKALHVAAAQLNGGMQKSISNLTSKITDIQAELEANIEFSEDIDEHLDHENLILNLNKEIILPVKKLIKKYDNGHILRDGLRMGIVGRPNVGKSSLLNRLIKKERAIVTPLPGTTRDLIEDQFSIAGIPIIITDTAGLHDTTDPVEIIGIQKTHENIEQSDLVLFVVDAKTPFLLEDDNIFNLIQSQNVLLVINKIDLVDDSNEIYIPEKYKQYPVVYTSALYEHGFKDIRNAISSLCFGGIRIDPGRTIIPNLRQKLTLENAIKALESVRVGLEKKLSEELIVNDLAKAKDELKQVIGENVQDDILDAVFGKFCIGK